LIKSATGVSAGVGFEPPPEEEPQDEIVNKTNPIKPKKNLFMIKYFESVKLKILDNKMPFNSFYLVS
jgi:hypothetical protein